MTRSDLAMYQNGHKYYIVHPTEGKIYSREKTAILQNLGAWELMDGSVWQMDNFVGASTELTDMQLFDNAPRAQLYKEIRSKPVPKYITMILAMEKERKRKDNERTQARKRARRLLAKVSKLAELPTEIAKS